MVKVGPYRLVARLTGILLLLMTVALSLPLAVSFFYHDGAQFAIMNSMVLTLILGLLFRNLLGYKADYNLRERDSFWITAIAWLVVPLCGGLPYLFSETAANFTDATFEAVSGFTTTGSSTVAEPERLPVSLLLWRAMTQWFGGLGLILILVATLKRLQVGSLSLYDAEFSGTQQRKLHPHIAKSVSRMWHIYTLVTLTLAALLVAAGNGVLDAICMAMSTVSTGGFMTTSTGVAGYSNLTISLLTLFMFLSGINVAMLYNIFTLRWRQVKRTDEFAVYAAVYGLAVIACVGAFVVDGRPWADSVRFSLFHVASTVSTCGFYTVSGPQTFPFLVSVVTFLLIPMGAMAGSTGGGLKLRRLMTLAQYLHNYFTRMIHPNVVFVIKIDRKVVPADYVNKIFGFLFLYSCFIIGGAFVLTFCGISIPEAFCMAAANISNLGPSPLINSMGAHMHYALLPPLAKWTLMVLMLAGRLEIFALLAIVTPSYWKRRQS